MKKLIVSTLVLMLLLSGMVYADSLEVIQKMSQANIFDGKIILDGNEYNNKSLEYPFVLMEDVPYMPLDYAMVRAIGHLSSWNDKTKTFKVYSNLNRTYKLLSSEVENKWKDVKSINAFSSDAKLVWDNYNLEEQSFIYVNGVLYMPLSETTIDQLGWGIAYNKYLGLQINLDGNTDEFIEVQDSQMLRFEAMARFMMSRNKKLSYEEAMSYVDDIINVFHKYEVEPMLTMAILWQESWYDKNCEYKGALGLMQIMGSTGRAMGLTRKQLFDPHISIEYGIKYLRAQIDEFNGNVDLGILAYNQGPVRVKRGNYRTGYLNGVKDKKATIEKWIKNYEQKHLEMSE